MTLEIDRSGRGGEEGRTSTQAGPLRLSGRRRGLVLLVLCGTGFLISEDTSTHSIAVPTLLQQLGDRPVLQTSLWIPKVYVLAFIALLLVGGALVDRLGAKRVLVGGFLVYLIGSGVHLVLAQTSIPLLLARIFMGAGVAVIVPATLSILVLVSEPGGERARAVTLWAGCCAAGVTVVPLIAGLILNDVVWPRVVAGLGFTAVVLLIGTVLFVPAVRPDPACPVDWPATITVTLGVGLVSLALIQAPYWGWTSPSFGAALISGVLLAAVSAQVRRGGVLPHDCLRADPRVRLAMAALATAILALFGAVFLTIQYLQAMGDRSSIVAGTFIFLPACVATAIGAKAGSALQRQGCVVAAIVIGLTAMVDGLAIGLTAGTQGELSPLVAMVAVTSVGFAMVLSIALDVMSAALPRTRTAIPWAAQMIVVQVSGLLGLAIVGSLVDRGYRAHFVIPAKLLAHGGAAVSQDPLGKGVAAAASAGEPLAVAVQNAFLAGYRHGLLAIIGVVAAMVVAILVSVARARRPKRA
ncbi:MFS transporter [Nocardia sp. NPDC051756]|uniref:MFS transporter n=1 Tax=Nocardia sp. NPDC051756 TaxID=3154751 RepID=UPI003426BDB2